MPQATMIVTTPKFDSIHLLNILLLSRKGSKSIPPPKTFLSCCSRGGGSSGEITNDMEKAVERRFKEINISFPQSSKRTMRTLCGKMFDLSGFPNHKRNKRPNAITEFIPRHDCIPIIILVKLFCCEGFTLYSKLIVVMPNLEIFVDKINYFRSFTLSI